MQTHAYAHTHSLLGEDGGAFDVLSEDGLPVLGKDKRACKLNLKMLFRPEVVANITCRHVRIKTLIILGPPTRAHARTHVHVMLQSHTLR